jgi:hypothetical protein
MKYLSFAFLISGLTAQLQGGVITILNPSFETDVLSCTAGAACATDDTLADWTGSTANPNGLSGGGGAFNNFGVFKPGTVQYPSGVPNGVNIAYLSTNVYSVSISQILSANLLANDTYTLTLDIGLRDDPGVINPGLGCNGFDAALEAGGNFLNSLVNAGNASCNSLSQGNFTQFTLTYTSGANPVGLGNPLQIVLTGFGSGSQFEPAEVDFDNLSLTDTLTSSSSAPEPATFGTMAAVFAIGLVLLRSRFARPLR